ncbi:hypothetical protein [Mycobacterium asiaticum]|uniref:SnoaL-like domain-containing protein n=1 Tax=Mycobacterium asiaticum TaxID=1790 RepID=A0A1A3NXM5_MYCAS|nr:hypothetical protein [Mycobacterium asiaticum]OBK26150.1 hypothetical protein A5635_14390 [Mycobacterium asiaticum]
MRKDSIVEVWEEHAIYEFGVKNADLAVSTMVPDASVMHLPTMSGGFGREQIRRYYADVFIPGIPDETSTELVTRSVGEDFLVDESIMYIRHDREIPFLLPRVEPTGLAIEVPFVVIVEFRGVLMKSERLYWDQAGVFAQLGLLSTDRLPMPDHSEVTRFLRQAG